MKRRIAMWLFTNIYLGRLAPYVLGYILGVKPRELYRCEYCGEQLLYPSLGICPECEEHFTDTDEMNDYLLEESYE